MSPDGSPAAAPPSPSPFDDAMPLARILFSFEGRVPRKVYWLYGVLGPLLVSAMVQMLLGMVGVSEAKSDLATTVLLIWPCAAVAAKRWHDLDRSGWWVLINLVPLIGLVWSLIENGLRRGSAGATRFGADLTGQF
ncbi:MAG TPA: DUF805 domain-containing protein [Burkholderiaceae bacterium]